MPPDHPRTAEALLSQSDWVRALVRGLGVDESGAEDVVQSTWLAALSSPPRAGAEGASFRAWIARVARNFALRRIDRDARRAGRERATAREERLPSASDVVEREEARAEVVRALLDVHEPFRTALLLRFYEGLEPRDIARLQSVPDSTVRNRLKRGLALLRERLESSQGSNWRQRCLLVLPAIHPKPLVVPPASYPTAAAAASGGALVFKSLVVAATVTLAAGGAYLTWNRASSPSVPSSGSGSTRSAPASAAIGSAAGSASVPGSSAQRARGSRTESQLVAATPDSARAPATEVAAVPADAEDDGIRCTVRGWLLQPDGSPIARSGDRMLGTRADLERTRADLAKKELEFTLFEKVSGMVESDTHSPEKGFIEGVLRKKNMELAFSEKIAEQRQVETAHAGDLAATSGELDRLKKDRLEIEEEQRKVAGVELPRFQAFIVSDVGRPPHVLIASTGGDARELDLDEAGRFEFGGLRPDRWHLVATAPGFSTKRMDFEIRRNETEKQLDVVLEPSSKLRVKLATPDGGDLLDAVVKELGDRFAPVAFAMRAAPGPRITGFTTEGRFGSGRWRMPDETAVGDASGVLELTDALPLHVGVAVSGVVLEERLVPAGAEEVVFVIPLERIRALASGVVAQLVSAADGRPLAGASARLEEFAGAVAGEDGIAELRELPPGLHEIRFTADGMESRAEWVNVVAGARTDLGVRDLAPASILRGRVVDENGAPVQVVVLLRSLDGALGGRALPICDKAGTDAEGQFTFEHAGRRRYVATIEGEDWVAPIQTIDAREGAPAELVVHARRSPMELRLTYPVEPPPGASYVVETLDAIPVVAQPADGWRPLVARLGDGEYRARLVSDGRTLWTRRVFVHPGGMAAGDENEGSAVSATSPPR